MPRHITENEALARLLRPTPASRPAKPVVVFTFDDNPAADMTAIKPILDAKGIKATFCAVTSWVGNGASVTWAQLAQLQAEGHEINNHSATHAGLVGASAAVLKTEIADANATFLANGIRPVGFTYAGGTHDAAARAEVRKLHSYALTIGNAAMVQPLRSYVLDRKALDNTTTLATHQAEIDAAVAGNHLLIYVIHSATMDATALTKLGAVIDYAKGTTATITTVSKALDLVGNLVDTGDYPAGKYAIIDGTGKFWTNGPVIDSMTGTGTVRFRKGAGANTLETSTASDVLKWAVADALLRGYASDGTSVRVTIDTGDTPTTGRFMSALFGSGKHFSASNSGAEIFYINPDGSIVSEGTLRTKRVATGSRPAANTVGEGAQIYDTTLDKPIWSDGTTWRDAMGTAV